MEVFARFANTEYDFLKIENVVDGNIVGQEYEGLLGIFKVRDNLTVSDNMETYSGNASIHIRPDEQFIADLNAELIGHGVRVNDITYRITSFAEGKDFETGKVDFYRAELKKESLAEWANTELPLT